MNHSYVPISHNGYLHQNIILYDIMAGFIEENSEKRCLYELYLLVHIG